MQLSVTIGAMASNQHYVPQFYLKFFSKDKKSICLLKRNSGDVVSRASIKGQASKKGFYGPAEVEAALSDLEGGFSVLLRKILNTGDLEWLSDSEYLLLLQNLMLQRARTVSARMKNQDWNDMVLRLQLEVGINKDESLSELDKEKLRNVLDGVVANPVVYQLEGMKVALENSHSLSDLLPLLLVNRTNRPMLTSDAPVILANPYLQDIKDRGVLGTQSPGLLVLFPVNPKYCLMLVDEYCYKIKGRKGLTLNLKHLKDVMTLNKLQLHHSSSVVYFRDSERSNYVKEIWKTERLKLVDHTGKINQVPGIHGNGDEMGEIIHSYEDQLPLIPNFTFLRYEPGVDDLYNTYSREERVEY